MPARQRFCSKAAMIAEPISANRHRRSARLLLPSPPVRRAGTAGEIKRIRFSRHPRDKIPLPVLGYSRSDQAVPTAWLDGLLRLVPVPRRFIPAPLACDRPPLARLRVGRQERERQLLVPGLLRGSGRDTCALPASRSGAARRPP